MKLLKTDLMMILFVLYLGIIVHETISQSIKNNLKVIEVIENEH
jgi:hypothetical protein